jgi:hypothetical protein
MMRPTFSGARFVSQKAVAGQVAAFHRSEPMKYPAFADNSLATICGGARGVLAEDGPLQYDEWRLDADRVAPDPGPTRLNQTDIRFTVGIAIALALPTLIGMGIYIVATALRPLF